MARPRQSEVRDQRVNFRLTAAELIALRERASQIGKSVGDYARDAALAKYARTAAKGAEAIALEPATYHQIRRLGVNLNQIAKRLNAQDMPAPPELAPLLAAIRAALSTGLDRS